MTPLEERHILATLLARTEAGQHLREIEAAGPTDAGMERLGRDMEEEERFCEFTGPWG